MSSIANAHSQSLFVKSDPDRAPTIEQLQKGQKKIVKLMEKSQSAYLKTHQAVQMLKSSLLDLSENSLSLGKTQSNYSGLMQKLNSSLIHLLQRVSEQAFTLTKKMEHRIESLVPNLRKMKERYSTSAETFSHYKQKFQLLSKNVDKQCRTNIKQDELERLKRNKKKLQGAQREYQQAQQRTVKSYYDFNAEGIRDVQIDFASLISIFASDAMIISHEWMKHLTEEYNFEILSKKLQIKTENYHEFEKVSRSKKVIILQDVNLKKKKQYFDKLIEEKQLGNYLKKILEKESSVVQKSQPINEIFPDRKEQKVAFQFFQNIFNNPRFSQEKEEEEVCSEQREEIIQISQEIKNQNQVCEQLQIQQPTEISQNYEQNIQKQEYECDTVQLQELPNQKQDNRRRQNLETFDRLCEKLPKFRSAIFDTHIQSAFSPSKKAIQTYKKSKLQQKPVFKSPDQFFNVKNFQKQLKQKTLTPNSSAKSSQFENNLFCYNTLNPAVYKKFQTTTTPSIPTLTTQSFSSKQPQKKKQIILGFDSFDILMKQKMSSQHFQKKQDRPHKLTDNLLRL